MFFAHSLLLIGAPLIPLTRTGLLPRRTHIISICIIITSTTLLTITSNNRRHKLISPLLILIGFLTRQTITNQAITFIIISLVCVFLLISCLVLAQSEKSVLLQPSLRRLIQATTLPLRWLTALILVSGVVFSGVQLSRNCEDLWDQWSLFPVAHDIDTTITHPDYIVDGVPRPSTGHADQTKRNRLMERAEDKRETTKTTATSVVITPQKMVFTALCNASRNLRTSMWSHRLFQGGLIIIGTLLLVSILDIPLLLLMGLTRTILSLLDLSKVLPKHRRTIEIEQRGNKE
ncbi:MAG: hypothetical protein NZL83_00390 [Candidatus Absconditabacterales bacterium]|nr:hypothetical protein [Candidatus Absconditabacterales bacterium]